MNSEIKIIQKPDWISWDEIHQVLYHAHAENRSKGINMRKPSLPGDDIKREIGEDGVMLVALDGKKSVGTAALVVKEHETWYDTGKYGYLCFAAVLPEYNGKGIYKRLCEEREALAKKMALNKLSFDTHHNNTHVIEINKAQGFRCVDIKSLGDHWNVVMFKWLDGCPYSNIHCQYIYLLRLLKMKVKKIVKRKLKTLVRRK